MPSEPPPRPAPPRPAPLRHAMVKWHSNVRHCQDAPSPPNQSHPHPNLLASPGPYLDTHSPLGPPLPFRGDDEPTPIGDGARPRAVLTADTRNSAHKKDPPIFFCAALQHGWSTDTRCAIRLFLRLMRERVTSLPLPHQSAVTTRRGGGLPADLDSYGPIQSWVR